MARVSNSSQQPPYNSFSPMASELTLTYSSSDSDNSRPHTPVESSPAAAQLPVSFQQQQSFGDSSTNLLDSTDQQSYTTNKCNELSDQKTSYCYNIMPSSFTFSLTNKLLYQTVLADKLEHYPIIATLLQKGHYAFALFLGLYIFTLLVFWIPFALLSKLLTEPGVYTFILLNIIYIGRCILRLLAFPGTNVKVYGEIEIEFAKYSCKLLEGVAGTLEGFGKAIKAASSQNVSKDDRSSRPMKNWNDSDISTAYKRVIVYRDRVLSVYWQVLHCLIKENGRGDDPTTKGAEPSHNFYGKEIVNTCKRNLCCGNSLSNDSFCDDASHASERKSDGISVTKYGNNPLVGDIGNMMNLTQEARSDGRELYTLLTFILDDLSALFDSSYNILQKMEETQQRESMPERAINNADRLINHALELQQFVNRIKPPTSHLSSLSSNHNDDNDGLHDEESEVGVDAVRHRLEENGTASSSSSLGMIQSAIQSFIAMIDPPPHKYIFGLDVIRGCFLSRYKGSKQFWVQRNGGSFFGRGGRIDVIYIPSLNNASSDVLVESIVPMSPRQGRDNGTVFTSGGAKKGRKAVLYCNPNAGLAEVATGLGLIGGNTDVDKNPEQDTTCWTEFYISHGYDVYLFNYCGYGRSYAGSNQTTFQSGIFGSIRRLFYAAFLSFKPTSKTLKLDATAVASHILEYEGVQQLVIHGESIGGMAAAGAAKALTPTYSFKGASTNGMISLLICDRTFCNLEAVAQRLVGSWTASAIRLLTFKSWNTDVVGDFLASKCPKIVANDTADEIIHDYSSLKSGVAFATELTRGMTNGIGWMMSAPMEYRMADLENVSTTHSTALTFKSFKVNPPSWPADKRVSWKEAFHFAFCVKRIGKLATAAKKFNSANNTSNDEQQGIEVFADGKVEGVSLNHQSETNSSSELIDLWNTLSCCDGLCGQPLGQAVKEGFDCTVSWLCCAVVMGSQVVSRKAEARIKLTEDVSPVIHSRDFDCRPNGYQRDESQTMRHPIPLPDVLSYLKVCRKSRLQDGKQLSFGLM